ncbi:alpha/beta hydrolase [Jatrophihabitans endophyticus]|uniref:alpha/beta hydrolase n=1 Tax=Jatrophihabitans endophyticus TaxID=1206085 RepID=UPI0019EFF048|nr:alpha/beta fold hydrolase [Jatrophihabitans endophyticus]MBE7188521.1 alpha/beta fold hydrolase [Jatrophihabitans endophyticus]
MEISRETIDFDSHGTRCEAWYLRAASDELTTSRGRPCVVMAHGFGATRDAGLLPFAERFAAAGSDVLVFDYRGFGTSDGEPRQDVHHLRHREDYHAAIAVARARRGVDPSRIAIWGSSYSGGHVIAVAAKDQRVAAVISQGAAMDGLAALLMVRSGAGTGKAAALTKAGLRDAAGALRRRPPVLIPIVGPPGSDAVISAPGADAGYRHIMGPTFRNEMCARGTLRIALNRPISVAGKVTCPTFVVVAEDDNIAPVSSVHEVAKRIRRSEVLSFPCGHFDIYVGEVFEKSVTEQVEFLRRSLAT